VTLPFRCHECGIEKGYPCSFLDPTFDAMHGEQRASWCALEQAREAGMVVALVPASAVNEVAK
jgi:hypothetical protein